MIIILIDLINVFSRMGDSYTNERLHEMRQNAADAYIYTCIICDATEVFLVLLTAGAVFI